MRQISTWILLVWLVILSYIDIRTRELPVKLLLLSGMSGVLYQVFWGMEDWIIFAAGIGTGVVFLLISKITKEKIGYGDSAVILILGIWSGGRSLIGILGISFFLLEVFAVIVLCKKKMSSKYEAPFVPFLTGGYVLFLLQERGLW